MTTETSQPATKTRPRAKKKEDTAQTPLTLAEGVEVEAPAAKQDVTMIDGIEIEVVAVPARGGAPKPEEYPFSKLPLSIRNENGTLEGPSFFIPDSENPDKHLAAARKWVRKAAGQAEFLFHGRADVKNNVEGRRIWKTSNARFTEA